MLDADHLNELLEQENLPIGYARPGRIFEQGSANSQKIVLINLQHLTVAAQETIRIAKSKFDAPVICLIPAEDADKVGLIASLGIDDYVLKPCNPKELACRVKVLVRRAGAQNTFAGIERRSRGRRAEDRKQLHDRSETAGSRLQIDRDKKLVWLDNRKIKLTPKEYALFCLLASDPERVFSPQEIIENLWPDCQRVTAANVQQYIYMLRKKIEPDMQQPRIVMTIKGFGYRLILAGT
ncbi:MAG: winged helix-turn-helix domain-containing protein [Thiotrichales bacterium]|nr:MAG: winged helix-turn-helix domain-containing protein [Thiotrichales bacterium]